MNILLLCDEYPPGRHGGIGTAVQLLARELVAQGHRVVVAGLYDWGYGGQDYFEDEGVRVYRFRYGLSGRWLRARDAMRVRITFRMLRHSGLIQRDITSSLARYAQKLRILIREHAIDIAEMPEFQEYTPYISRFTPFPALPVPVVVKLHGSVTYFLREAGKSVPQHILKSEQQILNGAAAVSSVSRYTAQKTADYLAYPAPITTLYNGIAPVSPSVAAGKHPGLVVFTGSLVEKKGIYQLMKAWNIVHKILPDAQLKIFGKGPVEKISALLDTQSSGSVAFCGHIPRAGLFTALTNAGVAVFPSYAECFALAPMEAMACGTAVIYTTRCSGAELIEDGVTGLLADPDDVAGLAQKIIGLLQDAGRRDSLAAAGRQKIVKSFLISVIARQNLQFYAEVLRAKNS